MTNRLLVATRKGLLDYKCVDQQWQIESCSFAGQPVSAALRTPADGKLYAALDLGHFGVKLHRSDDDGRTWNEISCPTYAGVEGDDKGKPSLQLIWVLEADSKGNLWAGTIPGGLFKSADCGETWELNQQLWNHPSRPEWFGGGYDAPGIHSICVDPQRDGFMALAISCGGVWLSDDGGDNWRHSTKGMVADYMPAEQADNPVIQDPHRLVQCQSEPDHFWVQHHNGIFCSSDRCATWQRIYAKPSSFGFAVAVHPENPRQAWFVPGIKDEKRYPVDERFVVTRTKDAGANFDILDDGLPQQTSFDLVYRHGLDIDASGNCLAMGSTTGNFWVTTNAGDSWQCVSNYLAPIYAVRFV